MFYSHTILARKGPLGTVWCAAHLQNRLTKAQYTSTNIPSTVERIMFPEVPIALRMSGHLLLGVVRIYSKQVEYLYKECNVVFFRIKEALTTANVNLPENACQAPFDSITLPVTFELDALELENDLTENRFDDKHKKSHDEITLTDQIPTGKDPYVAFFIDPDVLRAFSEDHPESGVRPMEEDSHPSVPEGIDDYGRGLSSSDPAGDDNRTAEDSIRHGSPDFETLRDADHGPEMGHLGLSDTMDPDLVLEKQILDDKEALTPRKEPLDFPGLSPQSLNQQKFPSPSLDPVRQNCDETISFGHHYPDLAIRSSPPVAEPLVVQPEARPQRPKRGKRRQHFDNTTVLTNTFMKRSLEETNDIKRVVRNGPSSSLAIWRSNKRLRREEIFDEPLLTGLSADVRNCFQSEYISTRAHLVVLEDNTQSEAQPNTHPETECIRNYEGPGNNLFPEAPYSPNQFMPSPSRDMPSSTHFDCFTPSTVNLGLGSEQLAEGTGILPTPDRAGSTWPYDGGIRTPETSGDRHGYEHTPLFDIPESPGELAFLERDDNLTGSIRTPQSSYISRIEGGTQESDILSARTRAVATYLKRQSSKTPISEKDKRSGVPSGDDSHKISLNTILQGKTKKVSARMFSEILVLHNARYVKVQQEEAYGDIHLSLSSKLVDEL